MPKKDGYTPLALVAMRGYVDIVALFVHRDDVDADFVAKPRWTPFSLAAKGGHTDIVSILLGRKDVNVNHRNGPDGTPLYLAAQSNCVEAVLLLVRRADVDGRTPLWWATEHNSEEMREILTARGADY